MNQAPLQTKSDPNATYKPYGGADKLFRAHDRQILYVGPSGTGKTRAVLEKMYLMAMKHPGIRVLLARSTRASMNESVLVTLERKVLPESCGLHTGTQRNTRSNYTLSNGSELVVLGLDNVNRIMSADYDAAAVFEATEIAEDDWEKIDTRLRNGKLGYYQMIADCNPGSPNHWLKQRADKGSMTVIESQHSDNPTCTPEYLAALSRLTGHRRARLFEGRWAMPEGLVYPAFMEAVVEPWAEIPEGRLVGGLDFGWNDPFAALGGVLYEDENGRACIYVFYERYKRQTPMSAHAEALRRLERMTWYCDPSRPDLIREMRVADIWTRPANNAILAGVDAVSARLESGRLFISSQCTAIIAEAQGYAYPKDGLGEKPEGGMDHAMDALRYLVMAIDGRHLARS